MRAHVVLEDAGPHPLEVTWLYAKLLGGAAIVYLILNFFWGRYVLLSFDDIWGVGLSTEGLTRVWPIFAWAFGITLVLGLAVARFGYASRLSVLLRGVWGSIHAGVFEEIVYRWLVFFTAMITIPFFNWITFGLVKWFNMHVLIPLADWATLHNLHEQLYDPRSWVLGAAIVLACSAFRDKHAYLGPLGYVNSWFMGMVFFWLVFNYGLLTAIVAHILYDVIIDVVVAATYRRVDAVIAVR